MSRLVFDIRRSLAVAATLLAGAWLGPVAGPSRTLADEPIVVEGTTMGTTYSVKFSVEAGSTWNAETTRAPIEEELESVNQAMSTYRPESEVSRFNDSSSTDWFDVSLATATVVARAQEISEASNGAFDVTVGPLVERWSFGPNRDIENVPSDEEIAALRERVGYAKLEVRLDPPALRKSLPNLRIDLSAIAKGYAVDRVALRLESIGIANYLVEVGGEVRAKGKHPKNALWSVGIRRPTAALQALGVVELGQRSLATSGDYENFYEVDGKRYSHTIDPSTGRPVEHPLASASIIADDCMTADALATAVGVMGFDKGSEVVRQFGGTLFVLEHDGQGLRERRDEAFVFTPIEAASGTGAPGGDGNGASLGGMILAGFIVFGIAIVGMAIGVMFGRKPISGSCGGLASLKGGVIPSACDTCGRKTRECSQLQDELRRRENP